MKINQKIHTKNSHDLPERQTITIEIEPGDDPQGHIAGLIFHSRLESFLRGFGNPEQFASPTMTADDFRALLTTYGHVAAGVESVNDLLLAIGRDQHGLSWRVLEAETGIPQATIRRRVSAQRARMAERGRWINATGIQWTDPDNAAQHASILDFQDTGESAVCRYCHETLRAPAGRDPLKNHERECPRDPKSPAYLHTIEIEYGEGARLQTLYAELDYDKYTHVIAVQEHGASAVTSVYARLAPTPESDLAPRVLRGDLIKRVEPLPEPKNAQDL